MPDLITHVAFASFFADKKYRWIFFLLLGAILPDITRLFFLFWPNSHEMYWFFTAMHSPLGLIMLTLLISFFFDAKIRKEAFWWTLAGVATHLGLDALQIHMSDFAYPWLFPFSMKGTAWGLFWPEQPLYVVPFLVIAALIYYYFRRRPLNRAPDAR